MTKEQPQQALGGRCVFGVLMDGIGRSFQSRWISCLVCLAMAGWAPLGLCVDDPVSYYPERSIAPLPAGVLGLPFGEPVVVEGQVISGPFKLESLSTEGRLLVRRINGVATQQGLVIRFSPVTTREWWRDLKHSEREELWKRKQAKLKTMMGRFYEMRGYEYGYHVGMTQEEFALQDPVQSGGFVFRVSYRPLMMKEVPEAPFTPADFEGRVAELTGSAETREGKGWLINADGWALLVRDSAWPADIEKREVVARGRVAGSRETGWRMNGADLRLLHLRDQLGKEVKLDGVAWSTNGFWWFEFRGGRSSTSRTRKTCQVGLARCADVRSRSSAN